MRAGGLRATHRLVPKLLPGRLEAGHSPGGETALVDTLARQQAAVVAMSVLEILTDLLVLHRALDGPAVDHQGIAAIPCSTDQVLDLGIVDEEQTYATAAELAVPLLVGMHAAGQYVERAGEVENSSCGMGRDLVVPERGYLMTFISVKMGMYKATIMAPMMLPTLTIMSGSMRAVSASVVASTSWS